MTARALVTGASGHVGGAVAAHLVALGWSVVGLSRTPSTVPGLAGQVAADLGTPDFVERVAGADAFAADGPPDVIVHAAATLEKSPHAPAISLVNGLGTQQMLALADRWGVRRFVQIGSVPVIGTPQTLPITEDHPVRPPTAYHAAKAYGDYLVAAAGRASGGGLRVATLRLTSPVGPGMPGGRIFSAFAMRARAGEPLVLAGRGTRRQNYVDVRDIAAAVAGCIEAGAAGLYHVAGAASIANLALAEACVRVLGSPSSIAFSGRPDPEEGVAWEVSIERAAAAFGYRPRFSVDDSIRAVAADAERMAG